MSVLFPKLLRYVFPNLSPKIVSIVILNSMSIVFVPIDSFGHLNLSPKGITKDPTRRQWQSKWALKVWKWCQHGVKVNQNGSWMVPEINQNVIKNGPARGSMCAKKRCRNGNQHELKKYWNGGKMASQSGPKWDENDAQIGPEWESTWFHNGFRVPHPKWSFRWICGSC